MSASALIPVLAEYCRVRGFPKPVAEHVFHERRKFRLDAAWPDQMIGLEVDGAVFKNGRHTRGKGVESDCEKFTLAAIAGWRLMRVTTQQVESGQVFQWLDAMFGEKRGS